VAWFSSPCAIGRPCVLDPEEDIGERHAQHGDGEEHEGGNTASAVACGAMTLLLPAIRAKARGPTILPTPFAACPRPEARAEADAVLLDRIRGEVRETALDEECGSGDQDDEHRNRRRAPAEIPRQDETDGRREPERMPRARRPIEEAIKETMILPMTAVPET